MQTAWSLQGMNCFFEVIPVVLGRSVNFNTTQRFLLRRPVFPDYLSVSCDYAKIKSSSLDLFFKKVVLKTFTKFTKNTCAIVSFSNKVAGWMLATLLKQAPAQVSSCNFCIIFNKTYFVEHLQTATSNKTNWCKLWPFLELNCFCVWFEARQLLLWNL